MLLVVFWPIYPNSNELGQKIVKGHWPRIIVLCTPLFKSSVYPLCELAMSPINTVISVDKMEKFWVLLGVGYKLLYWRKTPTCPVLATDKSKTASNDMGGTHNGMMMWKYFGGTKD